VTEPETLKNLLSRTFAESFDVRAVPSGLAISAPFKDTSGDRISFYVREADNGYSFEDDGFFLSHLVASGIDIERGQRRQLLDTVLQGSDAYWDAETYEIKSRPSDDVAASAITFVSALLRLRDIELLTKEKIKSTFREDATAAAEQFLGSQFEIQTDSSLSRRFSESPADLVLVPKELGARRGGVFLVNSSTSFLEAELLHSEIERSNAQNEFASIALIEDNDKIQLVGMKRFQRALNRRLPTPIFRGDEEEAMSFIAHTLGVLPLEGKRAHP
jgi:hypothetical protein